MNLSTLRLILGAGDGVGIVSGQQDPAPTGATPPADPPAPPTPNEPLGEGGIKALHAERDARAAAERQVAELAARVKEFEDANKSSEEKAAEERAALQRTSAENAAKALRYEAAEKAGIPLSAAGRLQGATLDELVADAESLKQLIGSAPAENKTPPPDPSQGKSGTAKPANLSEAVNAHYGV